MAKGTQVRRTIKSVGKYGFTAEGVDGWINISKFNKGLGLAALAAGMQVDYIADPFNGKEYAKDIKLASGSAPEVAPAAAPTSAVLQVFGKTSGVSHDTKDERITRLSALSTAFGAPFTAAFGASQNFGDAVEQAEVLAERLTYYALNGKFKKSEDTVPAGIAHE